MGNISIVIGSWGSYNECNERALNNGIGLMLRLKSIKIWSQLWSQKSVSFLPKKRVNLVSIETLKITKTA